MIETEEDPPLRLMNKQNRVRLGAGRSRYAEAESAQNEHMACRCGPPSLPIHTRLECSTMANGIDDLKGVSERTKTTSQTVSSLTPAWSHTRAKSLPLHRLSHQYGQGRGKDTQGSLESHTYTHGEVWPPLPYRN